MTGALITRAKGLVMFAVYCWGTYLALEILVPERWLMPAIMLCTGIVFGFFLGAAHEIAEAQRMANKLAKTPKDNPRRESAIMAAAGIDAFVRRRLGIKRRGKQ